MATNQMQPQERIALRGNYFASRDEIKQVLKMICEKRTITVRQLAAQMGTGTARMHGMINFLKKCGYIANDKRNAWDVLVSYTEIYQ